MNQAATASRYENLSVPRVIVPHHGKLIYDGVPAVWHDYVENIPQFEIPESQHVSAGFPDNTNKATWNHNAWGCFRIPSRVADSKRIRR